MKRNARWMVSGAVLLLACVTAGWSQQNASAGGSSRTNSTPQLPRLVKFSGTLKDVSGNALTGIVGLTFALYSEQSGGVPLWLETQNVQPDNNGHYTVLLGSTKPGGLPVDLFATEQARWVGVQVQGQDEQPRVLLVSAPYAFKAVDAETIGGLPPSAFVRAAAGEANSAAGSPASSSQNGEPNVGGSGTQNYVPLWADNNGDLGNSILYQSGSGSSAKIGVNLTKPLFTLDVNGTELMRGLFEMATMNYATPTKGYDSQPFNLESSAYNSGTATYTLNHFQWQAEPTGNNTTSPSSTLNLLYGTDPTAPTETGLKISNTGAFTFVPTQTFPGTGTITGITTASGSGLAGGGTNGNLNLSLTNACASGQVLQWNGSAWACASSGTISGVTAGTDLTGGGTSGNVTLNLDTTKVPQLNTANVFIGNQTVNGNVQVNGAVNGQTGGFITSISGFNPAVTGGSTGASGVGVYGYNSATSPRGEGVNGVSDGLYGEGVLGQAPGGTLSIIGGLYNNTDSAYGVWGDTSASAAGYGVLATAGGSSAFAAANQSVTAGSPTIFASNSGTTGNAGTLFVESHSATGVATYSYAYGHSGTSVATQPIGVWGDTAGSVSADCDAANFGYPCGVAVLGTVTNGNAFYGLSGDGFNDLPDATAYFVNSAGQSDALSFATEGSTVGGFCVIDVSGDLICTGTTSQLVPTDNGSRRVALYAVEAPENWFEDAGSSQLTGGSARIEFDTTFAQTVNAGVEYHVFLTPKGDSEGLYVGNETPQGFEVHEQRGGRSNIAFDYRIMAKRKGYEYVRLADMTQRFKRPGGKPGSVPMKAPARPSLPHLGAARADGAVSQLTTPMPVAHKQAP
jgi:hypothetical protein